MKMSTMRVVLILSVISFFEVEGVCKTDPLTEFEQALLEEHNKLRERHEDTPPLCYADAGDDNGFDAQGWADTIAETFNFVHYAEPRKFGENMAQASFSGEADPVGFSSAEVLRWYSEIDNWNYEEGKPNDGTMTVHFTQTVWSASTELRCGFSSYQQPGEELKMAVVICQYWPRGNKVAHHDYYKYVKPVKPDAPELIDIFTQTGVAENIIDLHELEPIEEEEPCYDPGYKPGDLINGDLYPGCKTDLNEFEQMLVDTHNDYRARHWGTRPLCYADISSPDVTFTAQEWADFLKEKKEFYHVPNPRDFGENMAKDSYEGEPDMVALAKAVVDRWYSEERRWDYERGTNVGGMAVHFTQTVWKTSKLMNCGFTWYQPDGERKQFIMVCQYWPRGNWVEKDMWGKYVGGKKDICETDEEPTEPEGIDDIMVKTRQTPGSLDYKVCGCWTRECDFCRNPACTIKQDLQSNSSLGIAVKSEIKRKEINSIMFYDDEGNHIGAFRWNKKGIRLDGCIACMSPKSLKGKCIKKHQHLWVVSIANGVVTIEIDGELVFEHRLKRECSENYAKATSYSFMHLPANSTFEYVADAMGVGNMITSGGCA